ncbi:MAG: CoA transferase [Dehalococcoidia bacterium]|jgi:formyl-CoA transferase|nr:CoA transferase [Dehalococcoidia bacterium]MDP6227523.1 CoA transferase [Dehalococcoidia bacterium]MDP7084821.1 CoA transferase [Dehalococcoidia bacterium]MDP7199698.1 CoA transferase [Dehalococcoidia bacterium]MDP7511361.1 CoA transferase [Dehalococcoidia bacterium]
MEKALEGIQVVDFTRAQAGPSCTQMLAWLGASVVKVEDPHGGDQTRTNLGGSPELDSPFFLLLNGNKRSITLNLRSEKGQEICKEIIKQSDILVENYSLGVMERFNLGWDTLKELNPRLIYATIKGFGTFGRNSAYKCFEQIAQATSGAMSMTGFAENPPTVSAPNVGDSGTGMHTVIGILSALWQREKTGKGQMVEVAMQDAVLNLLRVKFTGQYANGKKIERLGNFSTAGSLAGVYPCKGDGANDFAFISISRTSPSMWKGVLKTIEREDLLSNEDYADPKYRVEHADEIVAIITDWTRRHDKETVMHSMARNGVPCGATMDSAEVMADPHLWERGMITTVEQQKRGPMDMIGCPIKLDDSPVEITPAPLLGQHTEEILAQFLGYDASQAEQLKSDGVV